MKKLLFILTALVAPLAAQTIYPNVQRASSTPLASTRVPFSDASGRLTDDSGLTFVSGTDALVVGGNLTFGTAGSILSGTTGSQGVTVTGTNQDFTITPSGIGAAIVTAANASSDRAFRVQAASAISAGLSIGNTNGHIIMSLNGPGTAWVFNGNNSGRSIDFQLNGTTNARIAPTTGNLLLGGLTTDGTGVLQFPASTTSAGGITFGTDVNIFRSAAGKLSIAFNGTNALLAEPFGSGGAYFGRADGLTYLAFAAGANGTLGLNTSGSGSITLNPGGTTALTLDSSQRTILAGPYVGSTSTLSGPGACNVTTETTLVTTTGVLDALTLADGTQGQHKYIIHRVDGGSCVLTATTKLGWSTWTSTTAGESIHLYFTTTTGWTVVGSYLGTIAP